MASTSYNAVQVLDLLDTDSSDSGSSGEEGDDIYGYMRPCIRVVSRARPFTRYEEKEWVWSSSSMRLVSLVLEFLGPVIGFK